VGGGGGSGQGDVAAHHAIAQQVRRRGAQHFDGRGERDLGGEKKESRKGVESVERGVISIDGRVVVETVSSVLRFFGGVDLASDDFAFLPAAGGPSGW
jgi:hypothetical protein